jgi:hypothetical protein
MQLTDKELARFLAFIKQADSCWEWLGTKNSGGYGSFWLDAKNQRAHRIAYTLWKGPILDGLQVCHHCDNPKCVNPEHLFVGTNLDNMLDCMHKGRHRYCPEDKNHLRPRGPKNHAAKLTEADVRQIRERNKMGIPAHRLGPQFGVTPRAIRKVLSGKTWVHVVD